MASDTLVRAIAYTRGHAIQKLARQARNRLGESAKRDTHLPLLPYAPSCNVLGCEAAAATHTHGTKMKLVSTNLYKC